MSKPKRAPEDKIEVKFSKETGAAYVDIRDVIKSELARIKKESSNRKTGSDDSSQGTNGK